nr:hypothetical protein [Tanacetum cinerariifolium]
MQTQTSNALHNAIMKAGGKDRPPMLAPGNYVQWKSRIKRYIDIKPNNELIHYCLQNLPYKFKWTEKTVPLAEAEAVQIILTGIDNDIYSTIDACPNACEMWKAIEMLKQGESINVQDLKTNLYWKFGKFTLRDGESLESYYSRVNQDSYLRINRGTRYENQRVVNVVGARENVGTQAMQNSGIQCYNYKEYGNVLRECQKLKRAKDATYHKEKMLLCKQEEARVQLNAEQANWKDDTDDESDDQELDAHYMYMAQIQEVTPDTANNSRPIFDAEPLQKGIGYGVVRDRRELVVEVAGKEARR